MTYRNSLALCAAVAITIGEFAAVSSPASAKSTTVFVTAPENQVVRHVGFTDLNLATMRGEMALNHRVGNAVDGLCDEATGGPDGSFNIRLATMHCNGEAWDSARPQIARAVQRAHDIAQTGSSTIAAAAITISLGR